MREIRMDPEAIASMAHDIVDFVRDRASGRATPAEAIAATAAAAVLVECLMVAEGPPGDPAKEIGRAAFDRGVELGRKFGVVLRMPDGPAS